MSTRTPSIFLGHGLPPMALQDDPYNSALIAFGRSLGEKLKGIVVVSSQWVQPGPIQVTSQKNPFIQHSFHGFQDELYQMTYSPPSSIDLSQKVADLLLKNSFEVTLTDSYGLDHGVWMPLRLIRPEADLPVVQMSLPMFEDARTILKLGHISSSLRDEGILLIGSGAAALNMSKIIWHARGDNVNPQILEFESWLLKMLELANIESILNYREVGPNSLVAHPSTAGLLPLFFTMGTSMQGDQFELIFRGFKYSSSSLLTFCLTPTPLEKGYLC